MITVTCYFVTSTVHCMTELILVAKPHFSYGDN